MRLPFGDRIRETPRMRTTRHGDDGEDLLFVLGWGNDPDDEHVSWLLSELVDAGYLVHAVTLPTNGWSFREQFVRPVERYAAGRGFGVVLSHSTGGLVAEHLHLRARNVFLSPWWGTRADSRLESSLVRAFAGLPTARRLYRPGWDPSALGDLRSETDLEALSPAFLATVLDAQERLGPFDRSDTVFYTPTDEVVDPAAIEWRTPVSHRRQYDGGHEFFASSCRTSVLDDVLAAIEHGPEAVAGEGRAGGDADGR